MGKVYLQLNPENLMLNMLHDAKTTPVLLKNETLLDFFLKTQCLVPCNQKRQLARVF